MDVLDALTYMTEDAGSNDSRLSRDLGKSRNYISVTRAKGSDIGASNLAKMASVLGWKLVLKRGDVELEVTPRD